MCPRRRLPSPGDEIAINYGDKSNEELLFLYGFAVPHNPAEVLTLMCPLSPAAEWDAPLRARLLLLARRGLSPRLHLPAADLPAVADAAGKGLAAGLPEGVLETLEVFIMEPQQLARELEAAETAEAAAAAAGSTTASAAAVSASSSSSGSEGSEAEVAGRRMAVLTTLVRLLELKILEMEGGEQGAAEPHLYCTVCMRVARSQVWRLCWLVLLLLLLLPLQSSLSFPLPPLLQAPGCSSTTSSFWGVRAARCRATSGTRSCIASGRSSWRGPTWRRPSSCCSSRWRSCSGCSSSDSSLIAVAWRQRRRVAASGGGGEALPPGGSAPCVLRLLSCCGQCCESSRARSKVPGRDGLVPSNHLGTARETCL